MDRDSGDKKRRSSGVGSKASSLLASARNSLNFAQITRSSSDSSSQSALQKLGKHDPALAVPQGQHNNSAGESLPGPGSTFKVGVWEDRNRKCRRTMEDTHAFLYNFLDTPAPATESSVTRHKSEKENAVLSSQQELVESDNGYFAIFDGHAGTFAADWCGKKLHGILEETIRKNPNSPIPELLDQTFTSVDAQLEKLPLKNSGCTAAIALLRWEDRVPSDRSVTGSVAVAQAAQHALANTNKITKAAQDAPPSPGKEREANTDTAQALPSDAIAAKLKGASTRQRVLYTANVGDARIILCRGGKALRLSYDHKGSDENEGKRITGAGGLILNNRVNGVLAVTRALGDTYMKHLVTGHPYTTETVLQPEMDEFIIIACDGLWDVCTDQEAVDLVRDVHNPVAASKLLVDHALNRFSTDNLSCMIVRMDKEGILRSQKGLPVVAGAVDRTSRVSEAEKIVQDTKQHITDGSTAAVGVSPSNNGAGFGQEGAFVPTILNGAVEEEPGAIGEGDSPEVALMPEMVEINRAREPVLQGTEQQ
ncbi:Protein phosphatase 2C -like protein 1 [Escovopsis weberi]|uniref:Protein phosphatase 2C-like protein 1 n=1 Tax=Escovopsis weberi TaxID=150374 RepID=A0A0M9VVJ9_ESCWE|nr:Protein phosphatase 2C -like protein 1 [Escovopsis weberi]